MDEKREKVTSLPCFDSFHWSYNKTHHPSFWKVRLNKIVCLECEVPVVAPQIITWVMEGGTEGSVCMLCLQIPIKPKSTVF
jgi:hypothetical protein